MASNGAIHTRQDGTRRSVRVPPEDHALSNTDWEQNRAIIGYLGQNRATMCHQNTYLPGFYGHGALKGPFVQPYNYKCEVFPANS